MIPDAPDPDPCAHVRDEIRRILADEDRNCLGVKVRPPIPVSAEERTALSKLDALNGARPELRSPGSPGLPAE
jgi:hypothetical protein